MIDDKMRDDTMRDAVEKAIHSAFGGYVDDIRTFKTGDVLEATISKRVLYSADLQCVEKVPGVDFLAIEPRVEAIGVKLRVFLHCKG